MVITLDLSGIPLSQCPQWYRNIIASPIVIHRNFTDAAGFEVRLDTYPQKHGLHMIRKLTGEETEITAMILKWS